MKENEIIKCMRETGTIPLFPCSNLTKGLELGLLSSNLGYNLEEYARMPEDQKYYATIRRISQMADQEKAFYVWVFVDPITARFVSGLFYGNDDPVQAAMVEVKHDKIERNDWDNPENYFRFKFD